jgi:Short C-terminal domain
MPNLTPEGLRAVTDIASRHGFSVDAAQSLLESLMHGQGSQAQFNHSEFGGMGQWSRGGMIMIGDMFNQNLKYRVDALCNDLSGLLGRENFIQAPVQSYQSQSQGSGHSFFVGGTSSWWPGDLGQPSSSGAQNDMRYAFFPAARRIAIQQGSTVRVYDSGDHQFSGFSQQQGSGQSLTFNSQYGTVRVSDLPLVRGESEAATAPPASREPAFAESASLAERHPAPEDIGKAAPIAPPSTASSPIPISQGAALAVDDVLKTIKSLAALRQDGILTEEEFAAKKAELLGRI